MHNENRSRQTQSTTNDVTNLNVQDTEGVTVVGSSNTITTTDFGAIDAARDFANSALDVGVEALRLGSDTADRTIDFAGRSIADAYSYGRDAIDSNVDVSRNAIAEISDFGGMAIGEVSSFGETALRTSVDSVLSAGEGVLDFARDIFADSIRAQGDLTQSNLTGLTALAKQTSESADDRVTRTAGYAFAAIGVIAVVMIWRRAA